MKLMVLNTNTSKTYSHFNACAAEAELLNQKNAALPGQSEGGVFSVGELPEEVAELVLEPCLAQHHKEDLQGLDRDLLLTAVAEDHQSRRQSSLGAR